MLQGTLLACTVGFTATRPATHDGGDVDACAGDEVATPRHFAVRDLLCGVATAHAPGPDSQSQRAPAQRIYAANDSAEDKATRSNTRRECARRCGPPTPTSGTRPYCIPGTENLGQTPRGDQAGLWGYPEDASLSVS